jgi:hypothetical protein
MEGISGREQMAQMAQMAQYSPCICVTTQAPVLGT